MPDRKHAGLPVMKAELLSARDLNVVKAAADVQQQILEILEDIQPAGLRVPY